MEKKKELSFSRILDNIKAPFCSGDGERFHDDTLKKVQIYPYENYSNKCRLFPLENINVSQVWSVFGQQFVNDCINSSAHGTGKWHAVPGLSPIDFPCYPGTVVVVSTSTVGSLLRAKNKAYFVGSLDDFYPSKKDKTTARPLTSKSQDITFGTGQRVYRAKKSSKGVIISVDTRDLIELGPGFNKDDTFIDLSNFEYTHFEHKTCYVVTKVITSHRLKLEMTQDGTVFYECLHEAPTPICYQVAKVKLASSESRKVGVLKSISRVTGSLPFYVVARRSWQTFFNSFIPNQERLGHSVGDWPTRIDWREPRVKQSFRPSFLSRFVQGRPIRIYPFSTEEEYRSRVLQMEAALKRHQEKQIKNKKKGTSCDKAKMLTQERGSSAQVGFENNFQPINCNSLVTVST